MQCRVTYQQNKYYKKYKCVGVDLSTPTVTKKRKNEKISQNFNKIQTYIIENYKNNPWDKSPKNRKILTKMRLFGTFLYSKYNCRHF